MTDQEAQNITYLQNIFHQQIRERLGYLVWDATMVALEKDLYWQVSDTLFAPASSLGCSASWSSLHTLFRRACA